MTIRPGSEMTTRSYPRMLASSADRDRSVEVLRASFVEGRLTKDELVLRTEQVLVSRFFGQLMALTADLPVGPLGRLPAHPATARSAVRDRPAVATRALVLGLMVVLIAVVAALLAG
jgi:hypothetical protein